MDNPRRYSLNRENHTVTPGVDNLGPSSPGGGISGIALGIANTHDRQSGIDASRDYTGPAERDFNTTGSDTPYIPSPGFVSAESLPHQPYGSTSNMGLNAAAAAPGVQTPGQSSVHLSDSGHQYPPYAGVGDGPYQRHSTAYSNGEMINPEDIADDGDEDFVPRSRGAAVGGGAAAGATGGLLGGLFGKEKNADVAYNSVPGGLEAGAGAGGAGGKAAAKGMDRKKMGWIVGLVLGITIRSFIIAMVFGTVLASPVTNGTTDSSTNNSTEDDKSKNQTHDPSHLLPF